jgi:hypothetical protein
MKELFVWNKRTSVITAEYMKTLLVTKFCDRDNRKQRKNEEAAYMYFNHVLAECEEKTVDLSLEEVLSFFTAEEREPPTGFPCIPQLLFHEERPDKVLTTASTCFLTLTIPVVHKSYSAFKEYFILSVKCHDGFGTY